jgi:Spy/CpxP family protein refolding chaperone
MMGWWKWREHRHHGHEHGCHVGGFGGGEHEPHRGHHEGHHGPDVHAGGDAFEGDFGGGSFGVRRPLRFLAHRLDLDEKQVGDLAGILNLLKTERAQAAVDHRRTIAGFADVIASEAFDDAKAGAVAAERVKSAEHLRDALVKALGGIHALLRADQRARFAYLIRTGALTL